MRAGVASAGVLSAAAVAFCLKKDPDNKGKLIINYNQLTLIRDRSFINCFYNIVNTDGTMLYDINWSVELVLNPACFI